MNERKPIPNCIQYSMDELQKIVSTAKYDKMDNSYDGEPVYKILKNEALPGEVFREYPKNINITLDDKYYKSFLERKTYTIEVSNLGRIRVNGEVKKQFQKDEYGDLYASINDDWDYKVYRFVAETWCECPVDDTSADDQKWFVHHITDNGFDNRPSNLIWVTLSEHGRIGSGPSSRKEEWKKICSDN